MGVRARGGTARHASNTCNTDLREMSRPWPSRRLSNHPVVVTRSPVWHETSTLEAGYFPHGEHQTPGGGRTPFRHHRLCSPPTRAADADQYWDVLHSGREAISEVPADRWDVEDFYDPDPAAPGKIVTRRGGFVDDVTGFDAPFFGVSAREAEWIDPQHRLLMETAWRAVEHAGIAPRTWPTAAPACSSAWPPTTTSAWPPTS